MYARGFGVTQNYVQAHMWLSLAAASRAESWKDATLVDLSDDADKACDLVAAKMTPDQIAEAQRMAREWVQSHPSTR
jgi:TPR repeat protein